MERASSGSAGPVAVAVVVVAELVLEREVRPDTVAPDTRNDESADQKMYWATKQKLTWRRRISICIICICKL